MSHFTHDDREDIETRLLRTSDLIDLRLEAPGCTIVAVDGGAELVAGPEASLVVHFPPQHLGEEVWQVHPVPPPPPPPAPQPPVPDQPSQHRAADGTRLVYRLPEGVHIPWTLEGVLAALPGLTLRVAANATAAGESTRGDIEEPGGLETAIEAPYRLIVSPSRLGVFRHSSIPVGPAERHELWRTHLTVRSGDGFADDDADQRVVRALWTRDRVQPDPGFDQPLTPDDRQAIVDQTHGGDRRNAATPLLVDNLSLSSLGAWFDWRQSWEFPAAVVDYRHQSFMGRDGYVRVAYPGFLFPFGHRCYLVKVTEREIKHRDAPVAFLWQRYFILVRQPTRNYPADDRDNPFAQVTLGPLVTPDLDEPPAGRQSFIPRRGGVAFPFTLSTVDRGGQTHSWAAPLLFVHVGTDGPMAVVIDAANASARYRPVNQIPGRGQSLAVAPPVRIGDTSVEVTHLIFDGEIDPDAITSRPFLTRLRAVVPAMRHLTPQAPAVDLAFAKPYLDRGLPVRGADDRPVPGTPNAGELILALQSAPPAIDFNSCSDQSGGFVAPNLAVRGISRALGAIGESGDAPSAFDDGLFDPAAFLSGAMPKLFGLFSLLDLLVPGLLEEAPAFVSDSLAGIAKLLAEAKELEAGIADAQTRLADEVAQAAHDGARGVAQQAKDALDASAASLLPLIEALVTSIGGLPGNPADVSSAAVALSAGLQPLADAICGPGYPAAVRSLLTRPIQVLRSLTGLAGDAAGVAGLMQGVAGGQLTARLRWRPTIKGWGLGGAHNIFLPKDEHGLRIDVEVRASAKAPPAVDILAELVDFELNLIGDDATGLMKLTFRRVGFHAGSAGKPEVDVVFGSIGFLGPLSFVDRLRELIPFDGFSDPPYVDIAPDGVTAGFDIGLPNVAVGMFSLENIALGADAHIPFVGGAMTVGFHFCAKDAPFRLTVMCIGGGGWLVLRASPKGMVLLELGIEACASLSVDLGVASGSVSIAVGVYLRLEADKGLLTAYFRIRGEVDVLGLISASITLELSLTYHFETGKLVGRASLVVEVDVLFFSASVEIVVERRLAGSKGDPTMFQVMPPAVDGMNADWAHYCDAFAPLPA